MLAQGFNVAKEYKGNKIILKKHDNVVVSYIHGVPKTMREKTIFFTHGLAMAELWEDYPATKVCKAVMYPGSYHVRKMRQAGMLPKRYAVVGWPKSDLLFSEQLPKIIAEERAKLKLPYEHTLLYAMSYIDWSKERLARRQILLKELLQLSRKHRFNLIVKTHAWMKKGWAQQLLKPARHKKGVTVIHTLQFDITRLFPIADALISEQSGTLWEFLATRKPSIQFMPDEERKRYPGGVLHPKPENLSKRIQDCFKNPKLVEGLRSPQGSKEWFKKAMNSPDGHATDRAIKFLTEVCV